MTSRNARLVVAALAVWLLVSAAAQAQSVDPRGIPPPKRNSPEYPERDFEKVKPRTGPRGDNVAAYRRLIAEQIRKDFQQLGVLHDELGQQLTATRPLDYKRIGDAASKIKSLAKRLDSNLNLGEAESKVVARATPEISDPALKSLVLTLRTLVVRFAENPIFHERGVINVDESNKAKADVIEIAFVSDEIKRVTKQLRRNTAK